MQPGKDQEERHTERGLTCRGPKHSPSTRRAKRLGEDWTMHGVMAKTRYTMFGGRLERSRRRVSSWGRFTLAKERLRAI